MAGLFLMFVMTIALSNLVNDYVQSASDSDDSVARPASVIFFVIYLVISQKMLNFAVVIEN